MKVGFSNSFYEKYRLPIDEVVARGKCIGYDGLELNPETQPKKLNIPRIKKALHENGFEIVAIGTKNAYLKYDSYLVSPLKEKREFVVRYIEECCRLANEVDCGYVQIGIALQGSRLEENKEAARKRLIESLRCVCEPKQCEKMIDASGWPIKNGPTDLLTRI